jgi:hypothetical protein
MTTMSKSFFIVTAIVGAMLSTIKPGHAGNGGWTPAELQSLKDCTKTVTQQYLTSHGKMPIDQWRYLMEQCRVDSWHIGEQ